MMTRIDRLRALNLLINNLLFGAEAAPTPCPSPVPGEGSLVTRKVLPKKKRGTKFKTPLSRNGGGAGGGGRLRATGNLPFAYLLPFLALFLTPASHAAPPAPTIPLPPLAPARPLSLGHVTQSTLPNGLRLVVLEDHRQPALWMELAIPAGTVRDPKGKVGEAAMVADLLTKGTTKRTESQIARRVDTLGANLDASAGADYLTISASGLSSEASDLTDLLADITLHPTFPATEVERYKLRTASAIKASLGDPKTLATAALNRLIYGDFAYGNFSQGTPESLAGLTPDDAREFYTTLFAPNVSTLFLAGDITPAQARQIAVARFGSWGRQNVLPPPANPTIPVAAAPGVQPQITVIDRPGAQQTEIRIGTIVPGYADPHRYQGTVASAILGYGSFGTRLMREIRIKRGLTYGAYAYFARNKQAGAFEIETFTKNASTGQVVKIALDVTDDLRKNPPPASELAERKAFLDGTFAVSVAAPQELLTRLVYATLYGHGAGDLTRYIPQVDAVTPAQVSAVLAALPLDTAAQVVLVGDNKAIAPQLVGLGTVRVIEPDDLDLQSPTLTKTAPPTTVNVAPMTTPSATPPTTPTPAAAASGQELLKAAVAAHGGDAFLGIKTIQATGSGELRPPGFGGVKVNASDVHLYTISPDRACVQLKTAFGVVTAASPGSGKGVWYRFDDIVHDIDAGGIIGDPTALLREAVAHNYAVRDAGNIVSPADNGDVLSDLAVTDTQGHETHLFISPVTHLLRRVETALGAEGTARFEMSDYHTLDGGINLPATIVSSLNGSRVLTLNLKNFTLNQPVDEKQFLHPAE